MAKRTAPYQCFCYNISEDTVLQAMADHGARTVEEIQNLTNACTGCRTCRRELEELLEAVADGSVELPKPIK
ncbi:MAG: (2Fe-2S)-binding protein [Planctomycetota bacterium]